MHEWHAEHDTNPWNLIKEFTGYRYDTDYAGTQRVEGVKITNKVFSDEEEAISYVTKNSYYSGYAYMAICTSNKKLSKGYSNALSNFFSRYNEYVNFDKNLTIAYGRKSSKATCPDCGSSISLKYGKRFKSCPVCGSSKIISDSNWKALDTKQRLTEKAAENLSKEAKKNNVEFVCGFEWHC